MTIIFCSDPLNERLPDSVYETEVQAAEIVELGDAQVAGLPDWADSAEFYRRLKERLQHQVPADI